MRKPILILCHNDVTHFIDICNQYTALFDRDKYHVTVAYLTSAFNQETKARTHADEVIFLKAKGAVRYLKFGIIGKVLSLCRERKFDTVICHRYKPSYIMMCVAKIQTIPKIYFVMHEFNTMKSWRRRLAVFLLAKKNMYFAGVSNAVCDDLRKCLSFIPKEKIITLYNCIDVQEFENKFISRDEARAFFHLTNQDVVFGNLARLAPNKDQKTLLRAFANILPDCKHAKLIIMGEGELEIELKKLSVDLNIADRVVFTGFVKQGFRYLPAFDTFILTSMQEAFGRVLIEAMLAKLPIIASRVNGIPEVVGDAGVLISPGDIAGFSNAMRKHYEMSGADRAQIAEKSYQRCVDNFSIAAFKKMYDELL